MNSGSNGNCYYIGNEKEAILIDAGISCRETEKRMKILGLSPDKVKAIFISHEHSDHIKGVEVIAHKYNLPVYITSNTLQRSRLKLKKQQVKHFNAFEPVISGNFTVTAFPKKHDAIDPHSFVVRHEKICVGVFTDIGSVCSQVINHFSQCQAAFLESNYDDDMLTNGRYPEHLKNRIRGNNGHLSNEQALDLFIKHRPEFMTHLLLSHLSKDNNDPDFAKKLFDAHAGSVKIIVASRYEQTPVYQINQLAENAEYLFLKSQTTQIKQLSLF